jgi:hypothetical protein
MSNTRHMLSAVALSLSMALSVLPAQAALPLSINGQEMPSLAPVVEQVIQTRPYSNLMIPHSTCVGYCSCATTP